GAGRERARARRGAAERLWGAQPPRRRRGLRIPSRIRGWIAKRGGALRRRGAPRPDLGRHLVKRLGLRLACLASACLSLLLSSAAWAQDPFGPGVSPGGGFGGGAPPSSGGPPPKAPPPGTPEQHAASGGGESLLPPGTE